MEKSKYLEGVEKKDLFAHGHRACGGCGQALAARLVADAAGENTIACVATGCLEVFSSPYPDPSWRIPFLHSLFENAAAVASGVEAAYKALGKGPVNIIAALKLYSLWCSYHYNANGKQNPQEKHAHDCSGPRHSLCGHCRGG
jgi:pyruvate/2-oxoacid:ferredoxin oxidoreductase beta subunit